MTSADEIQRRYSAATDAELRELANGREGDFTPVAWACLRAEVARRGLGDDVRQEAHLDDTPNTVAANPRELEGLGGWLAVFIVYETLIALALAIGAAADGGGLSGFALAIAAYMAAVAVGVGLIVYRSIYAPRYWITLLVCQILTWILIAIVGGMSGLRVVVQIAWIIPWIVYWNNSKRVKATFRTSASE
jgi:hypothetical protein